MGFVDRLHNAWKIFKTSFEFVGRDKSLLIIPIVMVLSYFVLVIPFIIIFIGSALIFRYAFAGVLLCLLLANFWNTFLMSAQSWMVHEVAQGKDTTVMSGIRRALHNLADIFVYSVVFMLVSVLLGMMRDKGGPIGRIIADLLGVFAGIIGKLILPAMIVTERSFGESVQQLKHAKRAIPEIATFEIGIRPITSLITFFTLIFAVILFLLFGLVPAVIFFVLYLIVLSMLTLFINNTYYTLLYLSLIERKHVKGLHLR